MLQHSVSEKSVENKKLERVNKPSESEIEETNQLHHSIAQVYEL